MRGKRTSTHGAYGPVMGVNTDRWRAETFRDRARDEPAAIGNRREELAELVASDTTEARTLATQAAALVADERPDLAAQIVPALTGRLDDDHSTVRMNALAALARVAAEQPADVAPETDAVATRLTDDPRIQKNAAITLRRIAGESPGVVTDHLSALAALLGGEDDAALEAARALATVAGDEPEAVRAVATTEEVADTLSASHDPETVEQVIDRLADAEPTTDGRHETAENLPPQVTVERGPVGVRRRVERDEMPVPVVRYTLRSIHDTPVAVTLTDQLPTGVAPEDIGFHPDHDPSGWTVTDETVRYERRVAPDSTVETLYGLRGVTVGPALLDGQPTIEWEAVGCAE